MKKILKLVIILGLTVCCLLAAVGCNPANKFAGKYERYEYEVAIIDINGKPVTEEMESDTNLSKAIDSIIAMVGTKVELTGKYILFEDSEMTFEVERYDWTSENDRGLYEITTNDEKLIIMIWAHGTNDYGIDICVYSYITGLDGKEYQSSYMGWFKTGETK